MRFTSHRPDIAKRLPAGICSPEVREVIELPSRHQQLLGNQYRAIGRMWDLLDKVFVNSKKHANTLIQKLYGSRNLS